MGNLCGWDTRMIGWTVMLTAALSAHLSDAVSIQRVNVRTVLLCTTVQMLLILYLVTREKLDVAEPLQELVRQSLWHPNSRGDETTELLSAGLWSTHDQLYFHWKDSL